MKKKFNKFLISLLVLGAFIFYGAKVYRNWTNRAHYHARLRFDAHDILKEIQKLQKKYYEKNKTYADSISLLVSTFDNASRNLKKNPDSYPGLASGNSYSGSAYFYSIEQADSNEFIAQAKYKGFAQNGDDIWQIKKDGDPFSIVTSKLYKKKK